MLPHIEIKTEGILGKVLIDGNELNGVRRVEFVMDAETSGQAVPILKLDLIATDLTIDTRIIPELPEPFKSWYKPKYEFENRISYPEEEE